MEWSNLTTGATQCIAFIRIWIINPQLCQVWVTITASAFSWRRGPRQRCKVFYLQQLSARTTQKDLFLYKVRRSFLKTQKGVFVNYDYMILDGLMLFTLCLILDELATDDWEVKEEKEGFSGQGEVAPAQETFQQVAFFSIALLLPVHTSAVRWASRWMELMDWWFLMAWVESMKR